MAWGDHTLTDDDRRRGGLKGGARVRQGIDTLKALEAGELVPAEERKGDRASCGTIIGVNLEARRRAGQSPELPDLEDLEPINIPESLLNLQGLDLAVRFRLLDED